MKMILLIDDSESYRFLLKEELSEEGYEVIPAGSIEEVFSKFKRAKPDMLVLEVRQQDVKEETLEKLKERYPEIPWIGHSTLIQCPDEFKKWVNFYLSKSPNMDGIKELIRGIRGGEKNHAAHC